MYSPSTYRIRRDHGDGLRTEAARERAVYKTNREAYHPPDSHCRRFKQCSRLLRTVQNASIQCEEFGRCALADNEGSAIGVRVFVGINLPLDLQGFINCTRMGIGRR